MKARVLRRIGASAWLLALPATAVQAQSSDEAADYCLAQGGALAFYTDAVAEADVQLCRFADSATLAGMIDAGALYRYKHGDMTGVRAVTAFVTPEEYRHPDGWTDLPVMRYCMQVGGQRILIEERDDPYALLGVCRFPDGSLIDEWTLYRGPTTYLRLAAVLNGG